MVGVAAHLDERRLREPACRQPFLQRAGIHAIFVPAGRDPPATSACGRCPACDHVDAFDRVGVVKLMTSARGTVTTARHDQVELAVEQVGDDPGPRRLDERETDAQVVASRRRRRC